jgi:hypothetical protein
MNNKALVITTSSQYDIVRIIEHGNYVHRSKPQDKNIEAGMDVIFLVKKDSPTFRGETQTLALKATLKMCEEYNGQIKSEDYIGTREAIEDTEFRNWRGYFEVVSTQIFFESDLEKFLPGIGECRVQGGIGYYPSEK